MVSPGDLAMERDPESALGGISVARPPPEHSNGAHGRVFAAAPSVRAVGVVFGRGAAGDSVGRL